MPSYPPCIRRVHLVGPGCRERFIPLDTPFAAPLRDFGVLMGGLSDLRPPYDQGRSAAPFHLLLHTFAGGGLALVGGRRLRLDAGETWLLPAGVPHRYLVATAPWSVMWFHLADDGRFAKLRGLPAATVPRGYPERFAIMIETIIAESTSPMPGALRMGQLCGEAICIYLQRRIDLFAGSDADAALLESVWARVAGDLARPWTPQAIAAIAGTGIDRLGRMMRRHLGRGIREHLVGLRIQAAGRMLQQDGATLAAIAPRVGYADAFALSKAYKRVTGRAPRA